MDAVLTRTVRFTATHHYRLPSLSAEENLARFGDQARPHTHDWSVDVDVTGPMDPQTGWVTDLAHLDTVLRDVLGPLDGADLNQAIEEVRDGVMQPSTEALARWIHGAVAARLAPPATVRRVRVREGPDLAAHYPA